MAVDLPRWLSRVREWPQPTTAVAPPPSRPLNQGLWYGGVITSNAGGSVFVLPQVTRAHLAELREVLDLAMEGRA